MLLVLRRNTAQGMCEDTPVIWAMSQTSARCAISPLTRASSAGVSYHSSAVLIVVFGLTTCYAGCGWGGCWTYSVLLVGLCYRLEGDQTSKLRWAATASLEGYSGGENLTRTTGSGSLSEYWLGEEDSGRTYSSCWEGTRAGSGIVLCMVEPSCRLT